MTPERWRRVRELFDEVSEADGAERAEILRTACGGDGELQGEVESLLTAHVAAGQFLEEPPAAQMRDAMSGLRDSVPRSRVGPYEIVEEIGQGGMGTVYLARRSDDEFQQTVAVKLVRRGMDTDSVLARFRNERQILAALEHPNIGRLLDGGSTEDGLSYFVMEHIPGSHLLDYCDERRLSIRQRLDLFRQICAAVAYAHRNLVVHRDIKPSNILVTPEGVPKLLDFGLAKLLQPDPSAQAGHPTETALRFLTPEYASPEQVRGQAISTTSDVYSLGVVLYELLTGHRPYVFASRRPDEVARAVCEQEPDRPSTAVGRTTRRTGPNGATTAEITPESVGEARGADPGKLRRGLRGDLDNIVLMALRKEPERRYASADRLSDDILRHLEGRPVLARKDTLQYRAGKFVARHRIAVAAATLAVALLTGAVLVAVGEARAARAERATAERHFNEVRELAGAFLFEFDDAIRNLPGATPARELVVRRALEYLEKLSKHRSDNPGLQRDLASAYERIAKVQGGLFESHLGDTQGARQSLQKALEIRGRLAAADPADVLDQAALAETRLQLSQVLIVSHDTSGAIGLARAAAERLDALAAVSPGDPRMRARAARARRHLGTALVYGGDREGAIVALSGAAATFENLAQSGSAAESDRRELAITLQQLIFTLKGAASRPAAEDAYRRAVAIQQGLGQADPRNFPLRRELAYTHSSMGWFLDGAGDGKGAVICHRRAEVILEELLAADPRNADARLLLAETQNNVGYLAAHQGEVDGGLETLRKSLKHFQQVTASDPINVRAQIGLARLYESLGTVTEKASPHDAAEAAGWYRRSRATYLALRARGLLDSELTRELEQVEGKLARPQK